LISSCWRLHAGAVTEFIRHFPSRIITSTIPSAGVQRAKLTTGRSRSVKLIGATSHYVTEVLDDGRYRAGRGAYFAADNLEDLVQKGPIWEKIVLSRAVRWCIENRVSVVCEQDGGVLIRSCQTSVISCQSSGVVGFLITDG